MAIFQKSIAIFFGNRSKQENMSGNFHKPSFELPFGMKYIQRQPEDKWYHNVSLEAPPPAGFFGIQTTRKKTETISRPWTTSVCWCLWSQPFFLGGIKGNKSGSPSKPLVINKKTKRLTVFQICEDSFPGSMSPWVHMLVNIIQHANMVAFHSHALYYLMMLTLLALLVMMVWHVWFLIMSILKKLTSLFSRPQNIPNIPPKLPGLCEH